MDEDELYFLNEEFDDRAAECIDLLTNEPNDFFSQTDINSILISKFDFSKLQDNNASGHEYNHFMKCMIEYMVRTKLFDSMFIKEFIDEGTFGFVHSGNMQAMYPGGEPIKNLFVVKTNDDEDINKEILAGYILNSVKPLAPNFSYQYAAKDNEKTDINWCTWLGRMSVTQFVHGTTLHKFLTTIGIHGSQKNCSYSVKKGIVSGDLCNPVYQDEPSSDLVERPVDSRFLYRDLDAIVLQLFNALDIAYSLNKFTHHDLHFGNIMIQTLPEPVLVPIYTEQIKVENGKIKDTPYIYIETRYIPVIIDYGMAYFEHQGEEFKTITLDNKYSLIRSRCYPSSDIYQILDYMSRCHVGYEKLFESMFAYVEDISNLSNEYTYTYREVLNRIINEIVYNEDKTMHTGVFASTGTTRLSKPFAPSFTDGKIRSAVQKYNAEKYNITADMSEYNDEYYNKEIESIVSMLTERINAFNEFKPTVNEWIEKHGNPFMLELELEEFFMIGEIKIEKYINDLVMLGYNVKNMPEFCNFVNEMCEIMKCDTRFTKRGREIKTLRRYLS